jgi:hypothetical protein
VVGTSTRGAAMEAYHNGPISEKAYHNGPIAENGELPPLPPHGDLGGDYVVSGLRKTS